MTGHGCPHARAQHRHGSGRCTAKGCNCLFGPPPVARAPRPEPHRGGTVTTDADGIVLDYKPPSQRRKLEDLLWRRMADADLPEPEREYRFAQSEGRMFRADGFIAPDLLLEVEGGIWMPGGGGHNRGSHYQDDCEKYNLAAILGFRVLRFTKDMIRDGTAVDHIRRALESRAPVVQMPLTGGAYAQ